MNFVTINPSVARSKVAPLKSLNISRLELDAILLLAKKLITLTEFSVKLNVGKINCFL